MEKEKKDVYLMELNIHQTKNPFYFLYFIGEGNCVDFVLKRKNKIVLIQRKTKQFYSFLLKNFGHNDIQKCLWMSIDIQQSFDIVFKEYMSKRGIFIDIWNTIFDIISIENSFIPIEYKNELYDFMDFMTFESSKTITMFDKSKNSFTKEKILDAMYWCIGYLVSNSISYTIQELNSEMFDNFSDNYELNFICGN